MADDLDGEFWLPSQFMKEEDILTDFGASTPTTISTAGLNSELSSPGEPVAETESDKDEFFAELTRLILRVLCRVDPPLVLDFGTTNPKGLGLRLGRTVEECKLKVVYVYRLHAHHCQCQKAQMKIPHQGLLYQRMDA